VENIGEAFPVMVISAPHMHIHRHVCHVIKSKRITSRVVEKRKTTGADSAKPVSNFPRTQFSDEVEP
jgi:hypothetical protein